MASNNNTVLFQKGKNNSDLWDDSELIDAWNKQLDRIRSLNADGERRGPIAIRGEKGVDADEEETNVNAEAGDDDIIDFAGSDESDSDASEDAVKAGGLYIADEDEEEEEEAPAAKKKTAAASSSTPKAGAKRSRDEAATTTSALPMPPLPAGIDPAAGAMLQSWYEAGYRTGVYMGQQQRQ